VRFILPPGWVRVAPWERQGDFFVDSANDIIYGSAGVGRFELYRESVRNTDVEIGIHENASGYAPVPLDFQSVWTIVEAADSWLHYSCPFSIVIGIPPLDPNEGGLFHLLTCYNVSIWV
jgi:hypothetical protein